MTDTGIGAEHPHERRGEERPKTPARETVERFVEPTPYDPGMKRPSAVVAGVTLVLLRVVVGVIWLVDLAAHWSTYAHEIEASIDSVDLTPQAISIGFAVFAVAAIVVLLVETVLAVFIFRGRNGARVIVMAFAVFSIAASFVGWWREGQAITLDSTLPTLAVDILVLLALSSRSAAAYARRNERR